MASDLGVKVEETIGMEESIGPGKPSDDVRSVNDPKGFVEFNAVALVMVQGVERKIVGIRYINPDKSIVKGEIGKKFQFNGLVTKL